MGYVNSLVVNPTKVGWNAGAGLLDTTMGRGFKRGVAETFGWEFEYDKQLMRHKNTGFLGRKAPGGIMSHGKFAAGLRIAGALTVGVGAYYGYQEGGMWGATKSVATDAMLWGGVRAAMAGLGGMASLAGPLAIGAAIGVGGYALGESMRAQGKRIRNIEMGASAADPFGTISTIRQRSLQALQNSHSNGRMALGNEAILMHTPIMR